VSGSGTALLCLMVFANTVCVGAFGPLLPEIARAQSLADWQLGLLAGSFGFARMIADVPTGLLAGRRLGTSLAAAPALLVAGVLLLWSAGPFPVLVVGRVLVGLGHSFGMVAGLTAILLDQRGAAGSMRLMLSAVSVCLGFGAFAVGLGSFPFVVAGCALLGVGMAGWMFPLGVIREHTESRLFAWRTGLYRVSVDAAAFLGPVVCGLIGEAHTGLFVSAVGVGAIATSIGLGRRALRAGAGERAVRSP